MEQFLPNFEQRVQGAGASSAASHCCYRDIVNY